MLYFTFRWWRLSECKILNSTWNKRSLVVIRFRCLFKRCKGYHWWKGLPPYTENSSESRAVFVIRCIVKIWKIWRKVYGDGNRFYRAISKAIFGHEEENIELCDMTVLELVNIIPKSMHHGQLTTCVLIPQIRNMLWSHQCQKLHLYQIIFLKGHYSCHFLPQIEFNGDCSALYI